MDDEITNNDGELTDHLFAASTYDADPKPKKEFLPWHRPRKQFVRNFQWREQILKIFEHRVNPQSFKYLGLPGTDLLDIRYFHDSICLSENLQLKFLGFNSALRNPSQTDLNISLDEVRKLSNVDLSSDVIPDDFSLLANHDSVAWSRAKDLGPFDVINLDLCDSFAKDSPGSLSDNHYNAINQLMTLQAGNKHPWLLLLTTRTDKVSTHPQLLESFVQKYADNLNECPAFKQKSIADLKISDNNELLHALEIPDAYLSVFLTGLSKWMIGIGLNQQPPVKVCIPSIQGYKVALTSGHNDLVSVAFRFDPTFIPAIDVMGIATPRTAPPDECTLATNALGRVSQRKCIDSILSTCATTMELMINETISLLNTARYDTNNYRSWLIDGDG